MAPQGIHHGGNEVSEIVGCRSICKEMSIADEEPNRSKLIVWYSMFFHRCYISSKRWLYQLRQYFSMTINPYLFVKYTITWLQIKFSGQTMSLISCWRTIRWYMMIIREILGPSWFWNWSPHYGNQSTESIGLIIVSWSIWYQWIMSTSLNKKIYFQRHLWISWEDVNLQYLDINFFSIFMCMQHIYI